MSQLQALDQGSKVRLKAPLGLLQHTHALVRKGKLTASQRDDIISNFESLEEGYVFDWGHIREDLAEVQRTAGPPCAVLQWHIYPAMFVETVVDLDLPLNAASEVFRAIAWFHIQAHCGDLVFDVPFEGLAPLTVCFNEPDRARVEEVFRAAVLPAMITMTALATLRLLENTTAEIFQHIARHTDILTPRRT